MLLKNLLSRIAAVNIAIDTDGAPLLLLVTFPLWVILGITFFAVLIVGVTVGLLAAILQALIGWVALPFDPCVR